MRMRIHLMDDEATQVDDDDANWLKMYYEAEDKEKEKLFRLSFS